MMGLLDVNMPMLYGERKKAFHHLQLEIIRSSNDQSIFAWGHTSNVEICSILADDLSFFRDCSHMVLLPPDMFIQQSKRQIPELPSTGTDDDVFLVTNRGIQIRMLLYLYRDLNSVFRAYLPCMVYGPLVTINLVRWNSNYYRYPNMQEVDLEDSAEFRQVYLRYQDTPNDAVTFEIDDSDLAENGFICSDGDTEEHTGKTFMPTNANPFRVKTYSEEQGNGYFKVVFGQCFGWDWLHLDNSPLDAIPDVDEEASIVLGPDWAQSIYGALQNITRGNLCVSYFHLPGSPWVIRTCCVMLERPEIGVGMEVFHNPHLQNDADEWKVYTIEVSDFLMHMDY